MQILLITPQHNEFNYLLDGLLQEDCEIDSVQFGSIEGAKTRDFEITVAIGGNGKAQFAAQTQYLISRHTNVELIICAGASGALINDLSIGDVIVATNTIEHDYKERFIEESPPIHAGHPQTIEQLQIIAERFQFPFEIHFDRIASGDEDIVDRKRASALHAETNALCVAWEGSGGARAATLSKLPFLEIRVITDTANVDASEDFQKNLAKTIPNIAKLLVCWLKEGVV